MSVNITLNFIRENWSSATRAMGRREFCLAVLPDAFDPGCCTGQGGHFFDPDAEGGLSDQTINGLMRGNRKSASNLAFASVAFTRDFLGKLQTNAPVTYRDEERPPVPCVENMLRKIRDLARRHGTPRTREHPLFTRADFGTLGDCDETICGAYRRVRMAMETLLERESETSLGYAVFLLVVTAILQDRIVAADHLYSPAAVARVLESDADAPVLDTGSRRPVPFTDPSYMNEYHVYLYHDSSYDLFRTGQLTLESDGQGRSTATLTVASTVESPIAGSRELLRTYTGRPMLAPSDRMVHIAMADRNDSLLYLTFSYTPFHHAPMYFRSALLVSVAPETKSPQVQRAAIVARDLTEEELPYIRGLLKTGGKQVILNPRQLELFLETFRDYPWMADFRKNYLPVFETHLRPVYCFNEDELLSCSASDLPYEDRLRILLALRSVDPPNDATLHKFLRASVPSKTHTILK